MALKKKAAVKKKLKPTPAGKVKGAAVSAKKTKKVVKDSAQKKAKPKSVAAGKKPTNKAMPVKGVKKANPGKPAKTAKAMKPVKVSKPSKVVVKAKESKVVPKAKAIKGQTDSKPKTKAEKSSVKPSVKKPIAGNVTPIKAPKNASAVGTAKATVAKPSVPAKGKSPLKTVDPDKVKKPKDESVDPLHAKAEKAIREMEETMDLSKMRPRIQALSSAPKPLPKAPQTPVRLPEPANTSKVKFQLEFEFRSSPKILFASISDSSGLAGWFADEVITNDDVYTFVWEGSETHAKLVALRDLQLVRFQWLDENDGTYFQFEIKEDDITSDIALMITDFANPGEKETTIRLWESQIQKLRMLLGSL